MNQIMTDTNNMNHFNRSSDIRKKTASKKSTSAANPKKKTLKGNPKTKILTLRTTERQHKAIAYRAKKNGYASTSAYARDLLLNAQTLKPSISNVYYARKYTLQNQLINDLYDLAANADQCISPETIINLISTNDKEIEKYE